MFNSMAPRNVHKPWPALPFHYRWYSSLNQLQKDSAGYVSHHSLNDPSALTDPELASLRQRCPWAAMRSSLPPATAPLKPILKNAHQHGGVIGGVNKEGIGHVIHVLKANILWPRRYPECRKRFARRRFRAEAPWAWDDRRVTTNTTAWLSLVIRTRATRGQPACRLILISPRAWLFT